MKETKIKLEHLIQEVKQFFTSSPLAEIGEKPSAEKWSKKEILGHLIDSGINNLQRFTEIPFESKPYLVRKYNQVELVRINDYQNSDLNEILQLFLAINQRILRIIELQAVETLDFPVTLHNKQEVNLRFLIEDYVNHMEHHLRQIKARNEGQY
ncbi:DinB family protein [Xanthovirga aplysinae]|uniref:DinB family protein n=1 Tax=Xanthovirga aplysinae TaxID=2529853 RepID=UPI0012BD6859|nr:DinB family protein [Xanthovirga aplysinae]MTI31070.1 DinB family protein [Xanthovirga aplysinae]